MIQTRYRALFGACITQFTVIGLLFSYGLLIKEFEIEFGWSRTMLSSCTSVAFLGMGVLAIISGRLSDRYGPKLVLCFTGTAIGVGFFLMSKVTAPWHLFSIFGIFVALGMGTHDVVTLSTVARWFDQRRGIMTAVVKVGTAAGQVTIPPIAAILIISYGWKKAVMILGITASVLLVTAALNMNHPKKTSISIGKPSASGLSFKAVKKTREFWALCLIQLLVITILLAIPVHLAVHGIDLGMTPTKASILLSVIGASSVAGRLTVGIFFDRLGGNVAFFLCLLPLTASLFGFSYVDNHAALFFMAAIYGFGHGGFFTVISPLIADLFGMKEHGTIFGTILFAGSIGGSLGPIAVGWIFDVTGSYYHAFISLGYLAVFALLLSLFIGKRKV